jgi:hypothetical protein
VKTNKTRDTGNSRIKIQYLEPTIASVPCFVCLYCILSLLLPVFLVLFVFTLYLEPTIAGVPCFVCRYSLSLAYYCQCSLFCLSSLCILILLLPVFLVAIVGPIYKVKTNKTRNTAIVGSRYSEDKQNKCYCQCHLFCLSSLCILILLLPVSLVLFVFTLYLEPTIASVTCFVCLHCILSLLKIQSEDKQNKGHRQ